MGEHDDGGAGHHPGHGRGVVHGCRGQPVGVVGVLEHPGYPVGILTLRGCLLFEFFVDLPDALACGCELAGLREGLFQVVARAVGFGGQPLDVGEGPGLEGFQASQLTAARERVREIGEKLKHEAAPPRRDADWAARTLQNPDDPDWLAAASMHDAAAMAGMMPGSSIVVLTHHGHSQEPVQAAHRDFPESNPLAAPAADRSLAPKPPPRPAHGPRPGL